MIRYIPGRTKIKTEFFRGVTIGDIILGIIGIAGGILIIASNLFGSNAIWYTISWVAVIISMYLPVDESLRLYASLGLLFRFAAFKKNYSKNEKIKGYAPLSEITPYFGLTADKGVNKFINYGDYFGMVIEIKPLEFGLLGEEKQDIMIRTFANGLRRLATNQTCSIIKVRKPINFDIFMENDDKKFEILSALKEKGEYTDQEVMARAPIFEQRVLMLDTANREEPVLQDHFYMVVYGTDKQALEETCEGIVNSIGAGQMSLISKILHDKEIVCFLKSMFDENLNEREAEGVAASNYLDWILPKKIEFKTARTIIDGKAYRHFMLAQYPLQVPNAWGHTFFSMQNVKVVMKFKPVTREKAEKIIDRGIMEKRSKLARTGKSSRQIEEQTHLETLQALLEELKNNNEQLFDVDVHLTVEENARKEVKAVLRQNGFRVSEMFGRQVDAFVSGNISRLETVNQFTRGIPTTTIAQSFPFISSASQDARGFYIGENQYPVFVDFFRRDRERANSNMFVIGKSGSGKSYATKMLLANLAADKTKIFILDPEEEYVELANNMGGKIIDVGSNKNGIINPFHVMTDLDDEGETNDKGEINDDMTEEEAILAFLRDDYTPNKKENSLAIYLQFLEQFFKVVLEGISSDAFEILNSLLVELYKKFKIDIYTDLSELKPEDYPIFDDLYALINEKLKKEKDQYFYRNLQTLQTYIQKFATGGRNSNLWNGYTSIKTNENFVSFNFRTLFANRNEKLANAQMLLIFKYLNNEIINNIDFNRRYNVDRQVVVAVDEAHMFIDPKFPIALSFMAEMSKKIRKYMGMQIIITQNIKDFMGSPDIERQSSAIINNSQYSMIFQLAPNDMSDLIKLYSSVENGINKDEQDGIATAGRGTCFLISGPLSRTFVNIIALPIVVELIGEGKKK